jgi:hypothetical protein
VRLALISLALCTLLAGCASDTTSVSESTPPPAGAGSASSRTTATHHSHGTKQRRAPARARPGLVQSTADANAIQPQPEPGSCHARGTGALSLPDARCTPGAIDPSVTQANVQSTICRSGYTATVRPPESVTEPEKGASIAAYGDAGSLHDYEYDHLVPLELGGARNDPRNLWPEPGASPNVKDTLEGRLRELVCAGTLSLGSAQLQIASDWIAAYHRLVR